MKRSLLLASIMLLASAAGTPQQAEPLARLVGYSGQVEVVRLGLGQTPYPDFPLRDDDRVVTRDGRAVVRFADRSEVRLRPNTQIAISAGEKRRDVSILVGRVWSWIASRKDHTTNFKTGGTIAAVRGTVVEIGVGPDGRAEIGVGDGVVTLILADGTELTLRAGQKLVIGSDGRPGEIEPHRTGDIAAAGGSVVDLPEDVTFRLQRAVPVAGNNPFDPTNPAAAVARGAVPLSPSPTPGASPSPTLTPGDGDPHGPTPSPSGSLTPALTCSSEARAACVANQECCRPYQCVDGECCRIVTLACSRGADPRADCCAPAVCEFSQPRGRLACCFAEGERCAEGRECCSGQCTRRRCGPPSTPEPTPTFTPTPTPSPTPQCWMLTVQATDEPGTASGIDLAAGDRVCFQAPGMWCWGGSSQCSTADGTPGRPGAAEHPVWLEPLFFGVLAGWTGSAPPSCGSPAPEKFAIGSSSCVNILVPGQLHLLMNDRCGGFRFDNIGSLTVEVCRVSIGSGRSRSRFGR